MRCLIFLLCSVACSLFAETMTVASFNIRSFRGMDGKRNVFRTIDAIGKLNSDICGLQEVRLLNGEKVSPLVRAGEKLNMQSFFGKTLNRKDFEYGNGVLSRFRVEQMTNLVLPMLGNQEPRGVMILKVRTPRGKTFYFVNTHLSDKLNNGELRKIQLGFIMDHLRRNKLFPAVITGDFNALPASPVLVVLGGNCTLVGSVQPTFPARRPRAKIDYIAFAPKDAFEVISYKVICPNGISTQ